jgi:hypothetical protein
MTNTQWITYKWVNVQTHADAEPVYLCTGLRDIAESVEAEKQFMTWVKAANIEYRKNNK